MSQSERFEVGLWAVVVVGFEATPKAPMFVNVVTIETNQKAALSEAAKIRRQYKRNVELDLSHHRITVHVRPVLSTLNTKEFS